MNILVRSPNWVGDQILAFQFFHHLRAQFPEAKITAVCAPWVASIQFRGFVDDVVVLPRPVKKGLFVQLREIEETARTLRRTTWDLGITLPGSFSAAWLVFRSKAKIRRGITGDGRSLLLNDTLPAAKFRALHRAEGYTALLAPAQRTAGNFGVVRIPFDAETHWPTDIRHEPPQEPYWVLAPGSMAESRQWGAEAFLKLTQLFTKNRRWPVVLVGGPQEKTIAEQLKKESAVRWIDLTGQGPVSSLASIFKNARFTVSNDSGLAHVAALCGSAVEVIWGAGDPKHTMPRGTNRVVVHNHPVACWPCEKNTCGNKGSDFLRCLREISPETIVKRLQT